MRKIAALFLCGSVLAGCAGVAPEKVEEQKPDDEIGDMFRLEESAFIDSDVRSGFEAAVALLRAEKYEPGVELLESVARSAPEAIAPKVNLAIAYSRLDKPDLAEERLKQALEIDPMHPVVNNEYGLLLRKGGRFSEAKVLYEKALEAYPEFQPARKNLGILCDLYMNDWNCALENYQAYAKAVPGDESVQLWIVDLQRRVGD